MVGIDKTVVFSPILAAAMLCLTNASDAATVSQSARQIPVGRRADVIVVGGSLRAVAAAVRAAEAGASVVLVAPRTYVGDDLCATLALWLEEDERADGVLTGQLFGEGRVTTPLHVKRTLEAALLEARVEFLLASHPTDVLRDEEGNVAGVVIANRAGRQAIVGKVVVDATDHGVVAKMAGARVSGRSEVLGGSATPFVPRGRATRCRRVVLGGQSNGRNEPVRTIPAGVKLAERELFYYVHEMRLDVGYGEFALLAEAEQRMRDQTYRQGQLRASEHIQFVPSAEVQILLRPGAQERIGRQVGHAAALQAVDVTLGGTPRAQAKRWAWRDEGRSSTQPRPSFLGDVSPTGDIRETLTGLRSTRTSDETIPADATTVDVFADVDVVVVGGGTSGACAAIGAGRRGADVLVVEYQEGLGGVGTLGLIGKPYHGMSSGFTAEVPFPNKQHNTEHKMEWFRRQIRDVGGKIWFGVVGCGAYVERGRVRGVVVATPLGRGVVLANVVIDATGNADIAVAAGADSMYGGDSTCIALQGTGLPRRPLSNHYVNTDYLLVDESDMIDTRRAFVGMRLAGEVDEYDVGPFVQTRERRRVVGDHVMSYLDQIAGRTYPDTIVLSASDYDSHGYPSEPYFALIPHTERTLRANHPAPGGTCHTPYRCLLPRDLDGLLVVGLGISMLRDASAMVRMQKDMHNQGYAAGVAAAMAVEARCTPREIDVKRLQRHLVDIGNVPGSVLTDVDSFPLPEARIHQAVGQFTDPSETRDSRCKALAILLSHADAARPMLLAAYRASTDGARLDYAKVLGFLGESEGIPDLLDALAKVDRWDPKIFQGRMAEYAHLPTPVDALILALGRSGDTSVLPPILHWLERLDADVPLSHHRAVALSLERLAHPNAAEPLARLLRKPGMSGHAMTELEPLYDRDSSLRRRVGPLREIVLARALYRCGDHQGQGERILAEYRRDIRGLFARHAEAVLQ